MTIRTKPLGRATDAAVATTGTAFDLSPTGVPARTTQVKVYVSAAAYVGVGNASSPPTVSDTNSVYQESGTEEVYTVGPVGYLYVYSQASTLTARVSLFG